MPVTDFFMMKKVRKVISLAARRARQGGLPFWRQAAEMLLLWLWRRQGPNYYQLARFWRREMPWRDKLAHLTEAEYRRAVAALNPREYRMISQHKVVEKAVLSLLGIRTPRFLGHLHAATGRTAYGETLQNADDLAILLGACEEDRICFKPVEGWGGKGFIALERTRGEGALHLRDMANGEAIDIARLYGMLDAGRGTLIEAYVEQHETLAALNPGSLNTVRLWVVLGRRGYAVKGAFLRVGRAGSIVDNTSRGGLICPIDIDSGRISYADEAGVDRVLHDRHPDSQVKVRGLVVPYWEACRTLASDALTAFPHMRFAGLDIAIGPDGPWVIELNVQPDRRGAADFDVPTATALELRI